MENIKKIEPKICQKLDAVFCDLDDTLTLHGKLLACSYQALWNLKKAGVKTVIITGRPAGWVDHIARMWPVDAVIGENGAFYFWMQNKKMHRYFVQDPITRGKGRERLKKIQERVKQEIPAAAISADQLYRESDLAIDFCEDIPPLSASEIQKIVEIFQQEGAKVKVSSIHVNGWFGDFDKLSTCRLLLKKLWQKDPKELFPYIYCGDSPNDEPMFQGFPFSVGVANITPWLNQMKFHPTFQTSQKGGEGFAEMVEIILKKKSTT